MGRLVMLSCCDGGTKVSMFERDSRLTTPVEEWDACDSPCRPDVSTGAEPEGAGTAPRRAFNWSIRRNELVSRKVNRNWGFLVATRWHLGDVRQTGFEGQMVDLRPKEGPLCLSNGVTGETSEVPRLLQPVPDSQVGSGVN